MALNEIKQTAADAKSYGVQAAPDKLQGTPAQNKLWFDNLFLNAGMVKFNALIDALIDGNAAPEIGIMPITGMETVKTLQGALERFAEMMTEVSQGSVADGSITEQKLAQGAVVNEKLGAKAVTAEKIADGAVSTQQMAALAITTAILADLSVTAGKLASKAVTAEKIMEGAVTAEKIGSGAVTAAKIGTGAVSSAKLGEDVLAKIVSGTATVKLEPGSWANKQQTVNVSGVTANKPIVVSAHPDDYAAYTEAQIRAVAKGSGAITFACEDVPSAAVNAVVMIVG